MAKLQQLHDSTPIPSDANTFLSVAANPDIKYRPMPDPLSVYVPLRSLDEKTVNSIVATLSSSERKDWHFGRRTLLAFLLAIRNQLDQIEKSKDLKTEFDEQIIQHASVVRTWLVEKDASGDFKELPWRELEEKYKKMMLEADNGMAEVFGINLHTIEPYYELTIPDLHADVIQSREYMSCFRSYGWDPKELKLYWNAQQLEDLCSTEEVLNEEGGIDITSEQTNEKKIRPYDPSDEDAVQTLRKYPVSERNHAVKITYVHDGIEKAVFDVPEDAQIIVLNFANERSPGGGYLRHAWAQEEIILYNSDGYRSLLDLKYGRMGGGYAIPEFGAAYVRDMRFFDKSLDKIRAVDMLVSACYCLTGTTQLYDNPRTIPELIANTVEKFRAFIMAAVANTKGDGSNTYLLLGPIGTGAFGNETKDIGYAFREVLSSQMMGSKGKPLLDSSLDLNEVVYHNEPSKIYLGSPSIVRLSSGRLVASHDFFGPGYASQPRNASVYISDDEGQNWVFNSYIKYSYWTTLAVYKDMIYAIGTDSDENANIRIHRSSDQGASWNYNGNDNGIILFRGSYATGPTPIVIADQVMYRAIEAWAAPSRWPNNFQAAIISCNLTKSSSTINDDDDPLMSPGNWRITPPMTFNNSWIPKTFPNITQPGYLEGNVVVATSPSKQLRIYNILRFNSAPLANLAIVLELEQTTNTLSFVSIISFPGGMTKFTIRYDPVLEAYFAFVNPVTQNYYPTQRNILSLSYSKDLLDWKIAADSLLYDDTGFTVNDSLRYTGFHYVDWQFDNLSSSAPNRNASCIEWNCDGGPDMIYLVRTSYRGANSFHNSNRITYKTLKNYRALIKDDSKAKSWIR
ncbi:unnamed protein product [Adineta ricciae]|uniref:Microbial-type PARG catalytic domain-containing protein n=1 Tax=Adineta ricciae TaxID=249248 RepID=A0A813Q6Y4_ADIRI|nr:unnamed protein product [Adineta ricciae]